MASSRLFRAVIRTVDDVAPHVRLLGIEVCPRGGPGFRFHPGQWVDCAVAACPGAAPPGDLAGDPAVRVGGYSFASPPAALPSLELAVQRERSMMEGPGGAASPDPADGPGEAVTMTRWVHSGLCAPGRYG